MKFSFLIKTGVFILIIPILILALFGYLLTFHSYTESSTKNLDYDGDGIVNYLDQDLDGDGIDNLEDQDADGDGVNNIEDVVGNAKNLKGTFYEYLKGKYDNIGRRLGFLVCVDIPIIAYEESGIYFENLLRNDFEIHREYYDTENDNNTPETPFFFRRVRNLYSYFKANNKLIPEAIAPQVGDLIFYGRYHIALVTEIHNNGTYNEIETAPWTIITLEHKNKEWVPREVGRLWE